MADLSIPATSLVAALTTPRPAATPTAGGVSPASPPASGGLAPLNGGFNEALGRALTEVNALQLDAERAARTLASGKTVDMTEAVVTMEKASIAFQFALQIRNKLLEAYQDVMRMPV